MNWSRPRSRQCQRRRCVRSRADCMPNITRWHSTPNASASLSRSLLERLPTLARAASSFSGPFDCRSSSSRPRRKGRRQHRRRKVAPRSGAPPLATRESRTALRGTSGPATAALGLMHTASSPQSPSPCPRLRLCRHPAPSTSCPSRLRPTILTHPPTCLTARSPTLATSRYSSPPPHPKHRLRRDRCSEPLLARHTATRPVLLLNGDRIRSEAAAPFLFLPRSRRSSALYPSRSTQGASSSLLVFPPHREAYPTASLRRNTPFRPTISVFEA